jgi:hypothetical protein
MDDISVFQDKTAIPTENELAEKLGSNYKLWQKIHALVLKKYPNGLAEWNFPGKKYGWSYRIKDKRRAIIYLLPREQFFKVAFVFGDKAVNEIMDSKICNNIKSELEQARKYAEGRGIGIIITNDSKLSDIEQLIDIKLKY